MKTWTTIGALLTAALMTLNACAGDSPATLESQGFTDTQGGAGGEIIRVTNLEPEGPGSLRAAVESEGPRIVVFEVGGVIDLEKTRLIIDDPHVTIAGQTAPSPGITIIRGDVLITAHDVIIRHIRARLGDDLRGGDVPERPDAMGTSGPNAHDIIIGQCSISWGIDENLSASGPRTEGPEATSRRITFSNNIVAEALRDSIHPGGKRAMGSLIHDWCQDIALTGNLYAHNYHRNPLFKANTTGVITNNVIYNAGEEAIHLARVDGQFPGDRPPSNPRVAVVGNKLLHGPDSVPELGLVRASPGGADIYVEDNIAVDRDGDPVALLPERYEENVEWLSEKPAWPEDLHPLPAADVLDYVLARAGARPNDRDEADRRVVQSVRDGDGGVIDSQEDVGGYPEAEMSTRELDIPSEGVQEWLDELARELEVPTDLE